MKKQTKMKEEKIPKNTSKGSAFVNFLVWFVGIIVALAVGSSMIDTTLKITYIPSIVTQIAGWVVVIGAILSLILSIFDR